MSFVSLGKASIVEQAKELNNTDGFVFQTRIGETPDDTSEIETSDLVAVDRDNARAQFEFAEREDTEVDAELVVAELEVEMPPPTTSFFHVTPSNNKDSIEEGGLRPGRAPECPEDSGVYVAGDRDAAESWAATLSAERDEEEFTVIEVETPVSADVRDDKQPINPAAVPDSQVICTSLPLPPRVLDILGEEQFDPTQEKAGGFL